MRRPRVVVLRAGLYVAVALSGFAAAYVLRGWLPRLWEARNPPHALPDNPDDKTSRSSRPQDQSAETDPLTDPRPADEVPTPTPVTDPEHALLAPSPETDGQTPSTIQAKSLPPIRTYSLPPPLPSGHALLSGSYLSVNADTIPSPPPSAGSFHTSSSKDGDEDEGASQTNASDSLAESFAEVLSPAPTHVISRRRSMRSHDLFATSHISFSDLGSLVAPEDEFK
ncbi:hypothetical protein J3R82DRAFT_7153 [Butyriboletus roseoflavus]|nr:hypothetical protein J3R82DRAFT_7153 [Butyriboletus roseoflavus]